ncbi:MAG: ATP-binding protein [Coriobacteriia bacterium]|nr:ATP-binding protein [Coriobacteriia bacterium]
MAYIERELEALTQKIARTFKVLFLTGSRQVGKSTMLEHLFSDYRQVSFDDPVALNQAKQEPGLFMEDNKPPLLLDEVQYATELFRHIKIKCDKSSNKGLYLLTGSQQFHLMKQVSETLAGRVGILELSPLSLREIQGVGNQGSFAPSEEYMESRSKSAIPCKDIWEVIHRGGYPELQDKEMPWEIYYSSYVRTYLERDINELLQVRDQMKFIQFLTAAAARTAQLLNYQNMADELEVSLGTVKSWVSALEATGLVFILQPFTNSALNRAVKTPKLYFRDTGLACYLTRWKDAETAKSGAMAGSLFETFVVSEILKSYSNNGIDYRFHVSYYRGRDKIRRMREGMLETKESEIDLIIEQNGILHPVEIKLTANPKIGSTQAFSVLEKVKESKRGTGAIICLYERAMKLDSNTYVVPVHYL